MLSSGTEASRPMTGMHQAPELASEVRSTARLGVPLALGELGWMSTYIVDALMIGRLPHSALSISASSLGNTIFYALAFCAIGLSTGIETLVAQAYGRGDQEDCSRTLAQSMWFVALGTPVVMCATLGSLALLPIFGTPSDIILETRHYLNALVWSTGPLLLYWSLRRYLQSIDRVMLIMISLLSACAVNFAGDWAFLYGHLGLHAFGIAGSGWATCIVRIYAVILLLIALLLSREKTAKRFKSLSLRPDWPRLQELFRLGWPAALDGAANLGVSTFMSILCARLGATLLAAHQVVLDLDAFVYMVPLGFSYATAVRVGQNAGRRSPKGVRRATQASLALVMAFILVAASLFAGFSHFWAGLYTNDVAVVTAAAPIFLICGVLQLGDAAGIVLAAGLIGIGDTRTAMVVNLIWSWILGMPLSYWLTFQNSQGLRGLWAGRGLAAIGSSVTLAVLWHFRLRRSDLFTRADSKYSLREAIAKN